MEIYYLCFFAFLAGFIDAMVGGGGLIQTPAIFILMPQLSLSQSFGCVKLASFSGTATAAVQYLRRIHLPWRAVVPAFITALLFAVAGARLVSRFSKASFIPFIIITLVVVLIYTLVKKQFGLHNDRQLTPVKTIIFSLLTGSVLGFYDGVFGPGMGSFLIFAYVTLFHFDFLKASATAKIVNTASNMAALTYFIATGAVVFSIALPMAACNIAGSLLGSRVALKKGSRFVRFIFIIVVSLLIVKLAYDYVRLHW
jgi:uncharacterized protein